MPNSVITNHERLKSLEKMAFPSDQGELFQSCLDVERPDPTVSDVLNAIGQAQIHGIGTPAQRKDAFGRVIDTGATVSSPATLALRAVGGGILGNYLAGVVSDNPLVKGIGAGIGASLGVRHALGGSY